MEIPGEVPGLMEPRIQYAQTKDGVSIAYWTLGEGEPPLVLTLPHGHIQLEWQIPAGVAFDDRGEHSLKGVADPQRLFALRGGG